MANQCNYGEKRQTSTVGYVLTTHTNTKCVQKTPTHYRASTLLVDEASKYPVLSFLDAYSSFNQIQMFPSNENKMTFLIDNANYYYTIMLFGLENVEVTYQRLMDKIFLNQIERNMRVYVDEMVIKSQNMDSYAKDLAEIFKEMRKWD